MLRVRTDDRCCPPIRLGLVAASFVLLCSPGLGRAAVLCGRKNATTGELLEGTALHVRSACRATEVQASLASLGLLPQFTVRSGNQITTNASVSTAAVCQPGEVATGGGALSTGATGGNPAIRSSEPQPNDPGSVPTSWRAIVANTATTGTITVTAYAVCVSAP
jgi:hypothetical protein